MLSRYLLLLLVLLSTVVSPSLKANTEPQDELYEQHEKVLNSVTNELELIKKQLVDNIEGVDSSIVEVDEKSELQAKALAEKLQSIEVLLNQYHDELEVIRVEGVNDTLGMNFSVWTGILLASVAALVTTLGVVIAIGSVFGYKKIMDSSRKEAERVAKDEANKVAKKEVAERIDRGEFNSLVIEAVDRVAFGNINSNNELDKRDETE